MEKYSSFEFLKKISFERIGASENELTVANMLIKECNKLQIDAKLEDFEVDGYDIKNASLEANGVSYEVTGVGMSGSTNDDGLEGELVVITSDEHISNYSSLEGKIALIFTRMMVKTYKLLCERKCSAFICACGSLYDDINNSDLEKMSLRPRHYDNGKIPGVCMRMKDIQKMLLTHPKEVRLTLVQSEFKKTSHNVVATIPGVRLPNEIVCFTAHYDSVPFSTGAYDNGTGTATILESLAYFNDKKPDRTLKFIWCGSEEMGLLGSKAYTETHKEDLKQYKLCINVDMTGVLIGRDIACCTTVKPVADYINYIGKELGFQITAKQGVYSSDSTPFADCGVPSISFARLAPRGGSEIHSRKDVIDFLDEATFFKTVEFINAFATRVINSVNFPIPKEIPDEMKKELDIYFGRKEREEK